MQAGSNAVATALHALASTTTAAEARGALFAVPDPAGWYPALVHDEGSDPVRGLLLETLPAFGEDDLARLDAYEGDDYRREEIPVEDGGLTFMAHAWIWRGPLPDEAEAVPDGDFFGYAARHGLPVFHAD